MPPERGTSAGQLRAVALGLPETTEQLTWEVHPTFRVRGKIFVILGEDGRTASVKAGLDDQRELVASAPDVYSPAPHTGRYGWVLVDLRRADPEEVRELVVEGWRLTAPKRVVAAYDLAHPLSAG